MSHFPVIVVTNENETGDYEEQLAPFTESYDDEPTAYFDFEVEVDRKDFEKKATEIVNEMKADDKDKAQWEKWLKEKKYKEIFSQWFGGSLHKGNWGYWRNPNAKWDWYAFGGRWCAYFKAKEGKTGEQGEASWGHGDDYKYPEGRFDQLKFEDIDWEGMIKEAIEKKTKLWNESEAFLKEQFDALDKKFKDSKLPEEELNAERNKERERIWREREFKFDLHQGEELADLIDAVRGRNNRPFAFIDKDGVWHEEAQMGWWACTSNEHPEEFHKEWTELLKNSKPDDVFTLVDCHI